MEFNNINHNN